jgi:hypothetical protein
MIDPRHTALLSVVKRLPSDFEPYGERARQDWLDRDCSCSCRWFIALEGDLQFDWGVCYNPQFPRCGLLPFEHQGCREFEDEFPARSPQGEYEERESLDDDAPSVEWSCGNIFADLGFEHPKEELATTDRTIRRHTSF